ncbi:hypothetical protein WJX72_006483 [[Myrmecia] bisecta]|uniref:Rab-GAP TBC domain-containing protein n=1 Tax=[Myrmecia] bisecta TaxID=41462 RepID=A0AAW1R7P1_9CHLO
MAALALTPHLDTYGFALVELTQQERAARKECARREATMVNKWKQAAFSWQPTDAAPAPAKLVKLVRDGIPASLRPRLWLQFSGGLALKAAAPAGYYEGLLKSCKGRSASVLDAEFFVAFPNHPLLTSFKGRSLVQRLALAYARRSGADDTACSVVCLAAFLVIVMGMEREEEVFWTLTAIVEQRLAALEESLSLLLSKQKMEAAVAKQCPRLAALFRANDISINDLTLGWFSSLFTCDLPAEAAARVWDCLLVEGPDIMMRVAVALFKLHEPALLAPSAGSRLDRVVEWRVARTYNSDALMKMAFRSSLTGETKRKFSISLW